MGRFRKKPVEIEAMQWDGTMSSAGDVCKWVNAHPTYVPPDADYEDSGDPVASYVFCEGVVSDFLIDTLEGAMNAAPGDWIIRGVKGEFYPCKPDIFAATYDEVTA